MRGPSGHGGGDHAPKSFLDDSDVPADALSRVFVGTRQNKLGFRMLDDLVRSPTTASNGRMRAVTGPARCGKTALVREYLKSCRDGEEDRRPLKYLYVRMGDETKPASIAFETLRRMDDPNPGFGTPAQRGARVIDLINKRGYDLIVYDEAHNLVNSDTKKVEERGVLYFNKLLDECRRPLVLIGYPRLMAVIRRNPSLKGRTMPFPEMKPHRHDDPDDLAEFGWILAKLEPQLGLPGPSGLSSGLAPLRLCIAARGRLGLLEELLEHARDLARHEKHSCLTAQVLEAATAHFFPIWGKLPFNPFSEKDPAASAAAMKVSLYEEDA